MNDGIPCLWMRGGTSKGAYFLASDLPSQPAERDALLLRILGSPDPRQIDGIGGADPLTSKVAILASSTRPDADVDYLFLQVFIDRPVVTDAQPCGNILAGVGPAAIERGLVKVAGDATLVRIHMLNTGEVATARVSTPGSRVDYAGDTAIDGVPGTAAAVPLMFQDIAGSMTGALLPTGNAADAIDGVEATLIDNGMPCVVLRASDFGLTGRETRDALEADSELKSRLESIRLKAGPLMNLGDVAEKSVPKMTLVSAPTAGGAIATRSFIPHRVHASIGVLAAVTVATACLVLWFSRAPEGIWGRCRCHEHRQRRRTDRRLPWARGPWAVWSPSSDHRPERIPEREARMTRPGGDRDMSMSVGIDISKDWLDVGCFPEAPGARFANTGRGHAALIAWLEGPGASAGGAPPADAPRVVFEATGAYHRALAEALEHAGLLYCKVNPRQARRFSRALGRRAKTDRIDAAMLARMGQVLELEPQAPRGETQSDLNALSSGRQALVKDRTALLAQRQTAAHALVRRQIERRLKAVEADIAELDAALAALVRADPELRAREAILVSIPGLGATSATTILAEMPELGGMEGRQAAALAGVAPLTRSSGQWRGRAFIGGGRAALRRALYMPALVAARHNPDLRTVYERLVAAGKPKKLALVAVMRKLLVLANALLRDRRKWTPHAA